MLVRWLEAIAGLNQRQPWPFCYPLTPGTYVCKSCAPLTTLWPSHGVFGVTWHAVGRRSWVKEQRAKDSTWVEPWIEKEREAKRAAGKAPSDEPPPGKDSVEGIAVEQRCEVQPGGRRGVVEYLGEVEGLQAGFWVGVRFDEPVGRGDGTVRGKRLFECQKGFGGFVRGKNVTSGDFPERPLYELDDDEDEDEI
ncbi:unnamed protein product [Ectocarpus sp. 4 AP-2014]